MTEHVEAPTPVGIVGEPVALEPVGLEPVPSGPQPSGPRRHRRAATAALVAFVVLVAATVGVAMASRTHGAAKVDDRRHHAPDPHLRLGRGPAQVDVLSALSATTEAGSFDVSYRLSEQRPEPTTSSTAICSSVSVGRSQIEYSGSAKSGTARTPASVPDGQNQVPGTASPTCSLGSSLPSTVTGQGTINVNPKAMVVSASINTSLDVSVRLDDHDVWESGGADYGAAPDGSANAGSGQSLSGFAGLTEGTIGAREGAIGMLGMASPSGYLDLESQSVTGAARSGTGTVDGVPVTYYQVAVDPTKLVDVPGMSQDEITTVDAAVGVLQHEGYTGTSARVAVDGAGYIRQVTSVASFADGGTVTLASTFSKFGCAGTVTMPGQPVAPPPAADCTSPVPSTTPTTATTDPGVSTPDPGVSTTEPGVSTPSTEPPVSTTMPGTGPPSTA